MDKFRLKLRFDITLLLLSLWAMIFALMPLPYMMNIHIRETLTVVNGLLFWGLLIGSIVSLVFLIKEAGKLGIQMKRRLSFLSFGTNKNAKTADIFLAVSAIAFILLNLIFKENIYVHYISMAFLILFVIMHCMFNSCIFNEMEKDNLTEKKEKNIKHIEVPKMHSSTAKHASYAGRHTK